MSCSCPILGAGGALRAVPEWTQTKQDRAVTVEQSLWTSVQSRNIDASILSPTATEYHPFHCLKDVYIHVFIAALFITVKRCEQADVPPPSKVGIHIHTREYYWAERLKAVLSNPEQLWAHYTEWNNVWIYTIYSIRLTEVKWASPRGGGEKNQSHW